MAGTEDGKTMLIDKIKDPAVGNAIFVLTVEEIIATAEHPIEPFQNTLQNVIIAEVVYAQEKIQVNVIDMERMEIEMASIVVDIAEKTKHRIGIRRKEEEYYEDLGFFAKSTSEKVLQEIDVQVSMLMVLPRTVEIIDDDAKVALLISLAELPPMEKILLVIVEIDAAERTVAVAHYVENVFVANAVAITA